MIAMFLSSVVPVISLRPKKNKCVVLRLLPQKYGLSVLWKKPMLYFSRLLTILYYSSSVEENGYHKKLCFDFFVLPLK